MVELLRAAKHGVGEALGMSNHADSDEPGQHPESDVGNSQLERRIEANGAQCRKPRREELEVRHVTACGPTRAELGMRPASQPLPAVDAATNAVVQLQKRAAAIGENRLHR